jgi:hypothetical protein
MQATPVLYPRPPLSPLSTHTRSAVSARRLLQPCMPAKVLLELPRLAQLTK